MYFSRQLQLNVKVIKLSDWFYSLKYSEITQKEIKQFYYENHS